ncbi:AAA family ATPase [Ponticoccus sp. SC2-23]|uniref:ExeA family protein n=1 Tax=Alexandriicola marinus TaxID=2081710 RepID=UPI000FD927FB|nr:AAA family ATPase [Alexandriicola marinus]MBM1222522.1 AAA family ATPase [Ponticoccus sp. SC6-9]MBM1227028.1 AAA family ATPase [Ponticoccus sp. SC6-15]MBM1231449.1 AAA family ATPase [Ponticoccus sp. SC6-38]MBM1236022.1 AAA family ATPase [Ponticoccus sp. SC6-45]MBM1240472.1 AAA family ATPase [Ponticoccus sp. SC6-49]MBM1245007.1 AAA family ATPase [Ponticoccus sp. SC2-64]MBM1249496.1 AAA family ATPase [Ponticoccus sp. SC6-42]MBM1253965.1 AAA family ATPase [Ponticoccus sp. SC6-33]MBM1258479
MSRTLDIYTQFFGLTERPFSLVPDPGFLFWSPRHERAYTMLEYGILTHAPITLITGEVGAGKTTLLHHLLNTIESDVQIGLISNAHGDRGELLRWVLMALDQRAAPEAGYVDLFSQFQDYLIAQYGQGQRVILIFDEAQNLTLETLEELRMFTNINSNKDELLQLILVGQPELRGNVQRPELSQFAQRVAASYHIEALTPQMVADYIRHRLEVAGAQEPIFDEAASTRVAEASRGVPRLINQLCDLSMVYAFTLDRKDVTLDVVEQVLADGVFFAGGMATGAAPPHPRPGSKWTET